jgi:hypothetical protein
LGFLVPGVVTTPIGALSSPAAIAACMRAQNASSMSRYGLISSSLMGTSAEKGYAPSTYKKSILIATVLRENG